MRNHIAILCTLVHVMHAAVHLKAKDLASSIPTLNISDLKQIAKLADNANVVIVNGLSQDFQLAVRELRRDAPECLASTTESNILERNMDDGSKRVTLAYDDKTMRAGPFRGADCVRLNAIEQTFEDIHQAFVDGLEQIFEQNQDALQWMNADKSISHVRDASHKSHVHVYSQNENGKVMNNDALMVPFHTDNGLYLLLTPSEDSSLLVKNKYDEVIDLSGLKEDSVILMMGGAMSQWLLRDTPESNRFAATAHAVPSLAQTVLDRTVYARMRVAPMTSVAVSSIGKQTNPPVFYDIFMGETNTHQRRDISFSRWARDGVDACVDDDGVAGVQCWMSCMTEVPDACSATPPDQLRCEWDFGNGTVTECKQYSHQTDLIHGMGCNIACNAGEYLSASDVTDSISETGTEEVFETHTDSDFEWSTETEVVSESETDELTDDLLSFSGVTDESFGLTDDVTLDSVFESDSFTEDVVSESATETSG